MGTKNVLNQVKEEADKSLVLSLLVTRVRLIQTQSGELRYRIEYGSNFTAIVAKDGIYCKDEVNYIDFKPGVLIGAVCNFVADAASIYNLKKEHSLKNPDAEGFGVGQLGVILSNATMIIERVAFTDKDTYTNSNGELVNYQGAGYSNTIHDIKITPKAAARLDKAVDAMFEL
jgi:hypothetical protein